MKINHEYLFVRHYKALFKESLSITARSPGAGFIGDPVERLVGNHSIGLGCLALSYISYCPSGRKNRNLSVVCHSYRAGIKFTTVLIK